jgi:hypothetical protein
MSDPEQQHVNLVRSLEELAAAMGTVIETLAKGRELTLETIEDLCAEPRLVDLTLARNVAVLRQRLTASLNDLEAARGRARMEAFRALQREGHSIGEIARMWGISRQLASRLMRDRRDDASDEDSHRGRAASG